MYSISFPELQDFNKTTYFCQTFTSILLRVQVSPDNAEYLPADLWPVCLCCVSRSVADGQDFPPETSACSLICSCYTKKFFFLLLLVWTSTSKDLSSKWGQHNLFNLIWTLLLTLTICSWNCHNKPSSNPWQSPCLSTYSLSWEIRHFHQA